MGAKKSDSTVHCTGTRFTEDSTLCPAYRVVFNEHRRRSKAPALEIITAVNKRHSAADTNNDSEAEIRHRLCLGCSVAVDEALEILLQERRTQNLTGEDV